MLKLYDPVAAMGLGIFVIVALAFAHLGAARGLQKSTRLCVDLDSKLSPTSREV
jgi:hypothetical protein